MSKLGPALADLFAWFEAMELRDELNCETWTAICLDTETGKLTAHGPFDSPQAAQQWADEFDASVNRDEPNPKPIKALILPLRPED